MKYYILLIVGVLFLIFNIIWSGIVGSYIIDAEDYEKHLIFSQPPYDKENISDIDKFFYATKVSAYPYLAVINFILILVVIVLKIKSKTKNSINK